MNNDELTKKIVDILLGVEWEGCLGNKYGISGGKSAANAIADALIAAGIGDVKEAERLKIELKQKVEYIHELWEAKEDYKHRAEVAEKQTKILSEWLAAECKEPKHSAKAWRDVAGLNAEKELVEERKDD